MAGVEFILKQGDTLFADCIHTDADGNPVNLDSAGYQIGSAVIDGDGSRHNLKVTIKNQADVLGGYTVEGNSSSWAPGTDCEWDIRYTQGDGSRSYSTRSIRFALSRRVS